MKVLFNSNVSMHFTYQFSSISVWFWFIAGTHEGGPDGMDFDEEGYLLVANWGSSHIEVYGPNGGDPVARIKCPFKNPSNVHFKPNSNEVYVTEHEFNGVWKFTWRAKGAKQWCEL